MSCSPPCAGRERRGRTGRRARALALRWTLAAGAALGVHDAHATALEVWPVIVEAPAGADATTVTIRNDDASDLSLQVRVFKWAQAGGVETLTPTQDLVASPPIGAAPARASLTIRLIRNVAAPVSGEEAYRLVLDQLPRAPASAGSQVAILLRQVLPVFFVAPDRTPPKVTFSLARRGGRPCLVVRNEGDRRLRINRVDIRSGARAIALGGPLLGYALGHSEMSWSLPAGAPLGDHAALHVETDIGPLDATARAAAGD